MNKKKRTFLKSAILGVTAIATSLTFGMSAACSTSGGDSGSSDSEDDKTTTKIDSQTIKNGNFEFYSDNKGLYPICNPDNWTRGSNGSSSSSLSGVINTSKERWDYFASDELAKELEANDDLEPGDENKKDYNGALADDLPYKNPHTATDDSNKDEDAKDFIDNPLTPKYNYNEDDEIVDENGEIVETFTDDDGNIFLDEAHETPLETSILMLHNFRRNEYYGAETYYSSASTVSLEANTAAKISLWVKTTEMYFGGSDDKEERESAKIEFDRGAYIKVNTSVGGNSLDAFEIKNINTEQLIENDDDIAASAKNGWIQYTVYVAASSFATTTVNLTLGLGQYEAETVEGYAFFDDVSITKYNDVAAMSDTEENPDFVANIRLDKNDDNPNVSYPLSPDAQNEFRVDVQRVKTNDTVNGGVREEVSENNSADRYFYIDFASSTEYTPVTLNSTTVVKAGLTVDDTNTGKWVCTDTTDNMFNPNGVSYDSDYSAYYIPNNLKTNKIKITEDILATTAVKKGTDTYTSADTEYYEILNDALSTANDLPGAGDETTALVMLSAYGAAYEAHITHNSFKLTDGEYMLVSFWIKTSDMKGGTAATVTVKGLEGDDKDISSSFSVDSTKLTGVTIGENEDVYNGWARCFIRVSNISKSDADRPFEIVVNFGNTTIRNTNRQAYKAGWVALTNISVMSLDEDVYGYTSGSSQTATIGFTETVEKTSHQFDTEQGEKNEIKTDLAIPSSYTGVNGDSKFINRDTTVNIDGYHDTNKNDYAGILGKEYFDNYAKRYEDSKDKDITDCMWYNALQTIENDFTSPSENLWNAVFGERTVQPLLIVNTLRSIGQSVEKSRYNYGYIGNSASVSSNGYKAVSVRVKASAGAVANVYLVEDKNGGEVLTYNTPKYNFWYDADGNILKHEPDEDAKPAQQKENIAYTLRKDGLYEKDGVLYANFYNLTKQYDISFEHESFYDADGNSVKFEDLVKGETYFAADENGNANFNAYAPHYLVAGGKDNNKVYLYSGEGTGADATYYYVEDGKANKGKLVHGVDTGVADLRYSVEESGTVSSPYQFTIDTVEHPEYANKWITVTFYIHTGAESKSYKLELWSGARDVESSYAEGEYNKDSYVIFDYSDLHSSLNQSTFDSLVSSYTDGITEEYKSIITGTLDKELKDNNANISELEELAGEENRVKLFDYEAAYYTFSLFDSEAFIPFNGEVNTDDTGYSFDYSESQESLAFLKVVDNGLGGNLENEGDSYTMSAFIDYSIIDRDIDILGEPTAPGSGSNSSESESSDSGRSANVWLLASSIILVVAIFVAIAAIFIRDFIKKHTGKKSSGKNSYNFNKNKRYVKKYVKANGEAPVIEEGEFDESLMSDGTTATEVKTEETTDGATVAETETETEEMPAEETPAEEEKPEDDGKEED